MPIIQHKSRSQRKVYVKTPGGKTTVQYKKRKPQKAICGKCAKPLSGVPRERPYKMQTMAKTMKRPERSYGGVLCSQCMREHFKNTARATE